MDSPAGRQIHYTDAVAGELHQMTAGRGPSSAVYHKTLTQKHREAVFRFCNTSSKR